MVWGKIEANTANRDISVPPQAQEPVKEQDTAPEVVEVVPDDPPQTTDSEKPVEGYYIEKTSQEPDEKLDREEDDDIDTSVDPNARISILPSFAINKTIDDVTNAMEQAVNRNASQLFKDKTNDSYLKAQGLIHNNEIHQSFSELNFPKRFNLYGKVSYEGTNMTYKNEEPSSTTKSVRNSEKVDLAVNWKSKSERTKAFVFGSYTNTNSDLNMVSESYGEILSDSQNDKAYSVYGAVEHRFKNGDLVMGSGSHNYSPIESSKMTDLKAGYYLNKYSVLAEGETTIYKLLDTKSITKTDFSISLNPELASEQQKADNNTVPAETNEQMKNANPNGKKWSTALSPFFDTQSISGDTEEGLGLKARFKRTDEDSNLRIATFGKFSTTQQEENNKYHVTFGSGVKYSKNIGKKSLLKAEAEVKNRYTLGHENILTASAKALYTSPKFSAEVEAKRILISGEQPSYAAIVGRAFYAPNKTVNLYAEASYTDYKEMNSRLKGTNVQAGVIVNF